MELDLGVFDGALKRYSGLQGRKGRRSYLEQIEDLARSIRPRDPGGDSYFEPGRENAGQAERFRDWAKNARIAYRGSSAFCALLDRCGAE